MYVVYSIMLGGVFLIYLGIACRMGKYRSWYFVSDSRRSAIPYLGIPLGIGTILVGLSSLLPTEFRLPLLFLGWGGGFIVGLVFLFFQPSFLKPEWLKWLENEHKEIIMPFIKPEIREIGYQEWERRTATQEGLEEWVAEVRRKHGLEQKNLNRVHK